MTIPHSKPLWGEEEVSGLLECARTLQLKGGLAMEELEREIARDLGYAGAVATPTGSNAIQLALRARGATGEAVGCPSYVCRSVYDAIAMAGCHPRLLDIEPRTFSVSLAQTLESGAGTVVVAHMFGIRAPVEEFLQRGLYVIEDCAQRLAPLEAAAREPRAPVRILSFEATKLLAAGEGGLLLADDPELLARARRLRDAPYDFPYPAQGSRPTELQASVALAQWRRLPVFLQRRREIAEYYLQRLRAEPAMADPDTYHFRFLLRTGDTNTFIRRAETCGVTVRRPVAPMCLHTLFSAAGDFRACETAMREIVSLPIYPALSVEDVVRVANAAAAAQSAVAGTSE